MPNNLKLHQHAYVPKVAVGGRCSAAASASVHLLDSLPCDVHERPAVRSEAAGLDLLAAMDDAATPERPTDADPHTSAATSIIDKLAQSIFDAMPTWAQSALATWVSNIGPGGLRVGSIFSGSDLHHTAIEALMKVARGPHYPTPKLTRVMSVEVIAWKRQWIQATFPPELMFKDAAELEQDVAWDLMTGSWRPAPHCDILTAGCLALHICICSFQEL